MWLYMSFCLSLFDSICFFLLLISHILEITVSLHSTAQCTGYIAPPNYVKLKCNPIIDSRRYTVTANCPEKLWQLPSVVFRAIFSQVKVFAGWKDVKQKIKSLESTRGAQLPKPIPQPNLKLDWGSTLLNGTASRSCSLGTWLKTIRKICWIHLMSVLPAMPSSPRWLWKLVSFTSQLDLSYMLLRVIEVT